MIKSKIIAYVTVATLLTFGVLTVFLSSSVIFDWFGIREKEGNYVLFVVWANFISSWLYLLAVYGFIRRRNWTYKILMTALIILIIALIGLFIHINHGGIYETKTPGALVFRIFLTLLFTFLAYFKIVKK